MGGRGGASREWKASKPEADSRGSMLRMRQEERATEDADDETKTEASPRLSAVGLLYKPL
eukprot:521725-Hanusia_phi.AAC.1